jgi:hypothetical protein
VLICTLVSGDMDGCMYNMYIGIRWYGQLYVLICTLASSGKDGCMYFNMYICIWWYGPLYV